MPLETKKYKLTGISPLLMHNERLADPLGEYAQALAEVSQKRKKTIADHKEMSRIEWFGGLYTGADGQPVIPAITLEACIRDGAKRERKGKEVTAALFVTADADIIYDGPRDVKKLQPGGETAGYVDRRGVAVGRARIFRTRPIFRVWSADIEVSVDTSVLNIKDVRRFLEMAGRFVGLMDWKPRYGRFSVD